MNNVNEIEWIMVHSEFVDFSSYSNSHECRQENEQEIKKQIKNYAKRKRRELVKQYGEIKQIARKYNLLGDFIFYRKATKEEQQAIKIKLTNEKIYNVKLSIKYCEKQILENSKLITRYETRLKSFEQDLKKIKAEKL